MLMQKVLALGGGQARDTPALLDEFTIDCKKEDDEEGHLIHSITARVINAAEP